MSTSFACIAGQHVHRQWQAGKVAGEKIGPRETPFGLSGEIFRVETDGAPYYLQARCGADMARTAPHRVNYRANLYALKDLGVGTVLGWGPGAAVTHNMAVGDLAILDDVIDQTHLRPRTFFEDSPLGFLRQFPVFCQSLRRACDEALHEMKLVYHGAATAAVREGPRLETPAEVRMLSAMGAEIVTHTFAPEMFLARELQICYAAVCYIVNYAETGSRHSRFASGELFGGLSARSDSERLAGSVGAMGQIVAQISAAATGGHDGVCECHNAMADQAAEHSLDADWRTWFT